jgi:CBS domain-containing protein
MPKNNLKPEDNLDNLTEYIEKCISRGINEKNIIDRLVKAGWPKEYIEKAIRKLNEPEKTTQAPGHRLAYLAEDIVNKDLVIATSKSTVGDIIKIINADNSGYVLIVDNNVPKGIITGSDIVRCIDQSGNIDIKKPCTEIMSSPLHCCEYNQTVLDACSKMKIEDVERIPVLKKGKLIGIITASALIDFMSYG